MSKYCDICPNSDSDGISVYCNVKHGMVSPDGSCPDYGKFFKKRERDYSHYYGGGNFGRKKDKDYKTYWKGLDI